MTIELTRRRAVAGLSILAVVAAILVTYSTITETVDPPRIAPDGGSAPAPQPGTVEITYIANEGVLISSGDKRVLIDGLHREYERSYSFLPEPHRTKIETAQPPFDGIDVILVSHLHLDHFHPESVGLHLQHNPLTRLVSSEQVVGEVAKRFSGYETIKSRVTTATPPVTQRMPMQVGGIDFDILGVRHVNGRHASVQNLGHLIRLGGKKLLHLGDADTDPAMLEKLRLDEEGIDVALLPAWFLLGDEGAAAVREHIKPRHIVAVHMPPSGADETAARIKRRFPEAVPFTVLLEKRAY